MRNTSDHSGEHSRCIVLLKHLENITDSPNKKKNMSCSVSRILPAARNATQKCLTCKQCVKIIFFPPGRTNMNVFAAKIISTDKFVLKN